MNIPGEVLSRVKCDNCELYLSCGPIYFVHDSEEIYCGRCQIPEDEETKEPFKNTRVKQLEAYAELFEYPCKYEEYGCREKLPFALTQHAHEQNCEFKPHVCPVAPSGSCDWIGSWDSLTEHCRINHPDNILENNCELKHNFRLSNFGSFILTALNVLFLLQYKICTETAKIYYSLRYLGDSEKIKNYSFEIEINSGESKLIKKVEVLSEQYLTLQETSALQINLNSLLDIFNGSLDDVTFKIFIKASSLNCDYCGIVISERIQDDLICNNCVKNVRTCEFQSKGCLYKDFSWKCAKHRFYYCKYAEKCFIPECEQQLEISENIMNHLVEVHEALQCEIGSKFRIPFSNNCTLKLFILSSDIGNVFCSCDCYDTYIEMNISSPLKSKELNNFECKVTIEDPTTFNKQTITIDQQYDSWDDWYKEIAMNNFPSWNNSNNNSGIDVTININKIETKTYKIFFLIP